jgi:drug/metabolite transporter (DMT)-like permease
MVLCSGAGVWLVEGESLQLSKSVLPFSVLPFSAGVLHMLGQFCYFRALRHGEVGIISAYFNMTPLLVPIGAWLLLGERLSSSNYLAIVGLAVCSVSFCLLDTNRQDRWQGLGLMATASAMEAAYLLLLKHSLQISSVGMVYVASTAGMILAGAMPLLFRLNRQVFAKQWPKLKGLLWFVAGIEMVNLLAIYLAQRAIEIGSVSQVAGVEATTPASCFLLSWLIWRVLGRIGDPQVVRALPQKIGLTLVMAVLIWVVAQEVSSDKL